MVSVLLRDVGPENINVRSGVYRGVAGLRGKLPGGWSWESAALYTRAYTSDVSNNGARESLFQQALQQLCDGTVACRCEVGGGDHGRVTLGEARDESAMGLHASQIAHAVGSGLTHTASVSELENSFFLC